MSISRFPDYLPENPSFWMAADRDLTVPASGSNVESPANLAGFQSGEFFEQTNSSNQPTWGGNYWEFDGSDDSWGPGTMPRKIYSITYFGVYQRTSSDDDATRLIEYKSGGDGFTIIESPQRGKIRFWASDQEANNHVRSDVIHDYTNNSKISFCGYISFLRDEIYLTITDGNSIKSNVSTPGFNDNFIDELSNIRLGGDNNTIQAKLWEFGIIRNKVSKNNANKIRDALANKWRV